MQQTTDNANALHAQLLRVEQWLARGDPESLAQARRETEDFHGMATALAEKSEPEECALALSLLTARGHVERSLGALQTATESYRRALALSERARVEMSGSSTGTESMDSPGEPDAKAAELAEKECREALELIAGEERDDHALGELGLTARLTLCRALERFPAERERHMEISDVVEEGLAGFREGEEGNKALPLSASAPPCSALSSAAGRRPTCATSRDSWPTTCWITSIQSGAFRQPGEKATEGRTRLLAEWQRCREILARVRERFFELR